MHGATEGQGSVPIRPIEGQPKQEENIQKSQIPGSRPDDLKVMDLAGSVLNRLPEGDRLNESYNQLERKIETATKGVHEQKVTEKGYDLVENRKYYGRAKEASAGKNEKSEVVNSEKYAVFNAEILNVRNELVAIDEEIKRLEETHGKDHEDIRNLKARATVIRAQINTAQRALLPGIKEEISEKIAEKNTLIQVLGTVKTIKNPSVVMGHLGKKAAVSAEGTKLKENIEELLDGKEGAYGASVFIAEKINEEKDKAKADKTLNNKSLIEALTNLLRPISNLAQLKMNKEKYEKGLPQ